MDGSPDVNVKKLALEDLPKEELVLKCRNLLLIAQKAKQAKDVIIEENNKLKEQLRQQQNLSSEDIIEKLTQQKADLLTNVEELRSEKVLLINKYTRSEAQLRDAETKVSDLDIANQSYKRRVDRVTEENEQLIKQLDELEKQIEELKTLGLQQQQQLLSLEKSNIALMKTNTNITEQLEEQHKEDSSCHINDLQNKLSISIEEVKYLKLENHKLSNDLIELQVRIKESDEKLHLTDNELLEKRKTIESLHLKIDEIQNDQDMKLLLEQKNELNAKIIQLENELKLEDTLINDLKEELSLRNNQSEENANLVDDLKTELHKNKALVEKLQQDMVNTNQKLSDNQIMSSGVASDLQNSNEKLRERLKLYHMKIVKFAADIKQLKQSKTELLATFKMYTAQVSEWKKQLHLLLDKITKQEIENNDIKMKNREYEEIIKEKTNENLLLLEKLKQLEKYKDCVVENEKLNDLNKSLKDEINSLCQQLKILEQESLNDQEKISNYSQVEQDLNKTIQELQEKCISLEENALEDQKTLMNIKNQFENSEKTSSTVAEKLHKEKLELTETYNECYKNHLEMVAENNTLKSCINDLNNKVGAFQQKQLILEELEKELDEKVAAIEKYKIEIANLKVSHSNVITEKENIKESLNCAEKELHNVQEKYLEDVNSFETKERENEEKIKKLQDFEKQNNILLEKCQVYEKESENLIQENCKLKECVEKYLEENKQLVATENSMKSNISLLHKKLEESQTIIESLGNELEGNKREIINLDNSNKSLKDQLNNTSKLEQALAEKSGEEMLKLVKENNKLVDTVKDLEVKIEGLANTSLLDKEIQTDVDLYNFEEIISSLRRENAELLSEMNEMNQALKERGETISMQEAQYEDMVKKFQTYELQFKNSKDVINKKEEIIENLKEEINSLQLSSVHVQDLESVNKKDEEINQLKLELQELRDKLLSISQTDMQSDTHYAESENMSTSTISKTEEMNRMKDLDSSWEERYAKLRNFALKLKGKLRDLTTELQKEQTDKTELQQKHAKTIQTFQQQIDKLQDDLESSKTECKQYLKKLDATALDVSKDKKQLADNEEIISQLNSVIDGLNKEKTNTDNWKKQVSAKIQALKKEQEANNLLKKEFENRINKLNAELESKDKALKQEIERHNQTKTVLQESNNECKKQSVLNLEMQDYERSVKDLSQKIDKKQELINKLKSQLETQKTSLHTLKDQYQDLQETTKTWEDKYDKVSSENDFNKKKIGDFENILSERENKVQDLTYMLENIRSENEDLSTQLSKAIADHQKATNASKEECDLLRSQNMGLEQTLRKIQDILKMKEQLLAEMEKEYHGYKVRAQSILRQNCTRDIGAEEKLSEEAASLRAQVDILTSQVKELR